MGESVFLQLDDIKFNVSSVSSRQEKKLEMAAENKKLFYNIRWSEEMSEKVKKKNFHREDHKNVEVPSFSTWCHHAESFSSIPLNGHEFHSK